MSMTKTSVSVFIFEINVKVMAQTDREREIEILEWRIANTDRLMNLYAQIGISQEKIDMQAVKKAKHQEKLAKIKP